jgi:Pyruvate flavodoxin/ferredoxin oxidoreductase, thiamine diP-bdg
MSSAQENGSNGSLPVGRKPCSEDLSPHLVCMDGNVAVADVAYRINDCAFIFPIAPSSPMSEHCEELAHVKHAKNLFGQEMKIIHMQSEAGVGMCLLCCSWLRVTFEDSFRTSRCNIFCTRKLVPCMVH